MRVGAEPELHMHFDDLSALPDDDLLALEGRRTLDPADWRRVNDELRRRRRSRVARLADMPASALYEPVAGDGMASRGEGDLKRVVGLADMMDGRATPMDGRATQMEGRATPTMPTLGDLERVADDLTARLATTEGQIRRLRWWLVLAPVLWAFVTAMGVLAVRGFGADLLQRIGLP